MKNIFKSIGLLSLCMLMTISMKKNSPEKQSQDNEGIEIKGAVKEIIEAKCMGCHKPDSRNTKAKEKLQWEKVAKMDREEQEHLVDEMFEVLEDGKMPPKKAVERRPQLKLTDEETKTLLAWMEAEEKRLKGK